MPRFRSRNSIRPVQRIKHVIDKQAGVTAAAVNNTNLILASDTPTLAAVTEVITGAIINGIYLKVEVSATTSAAISNVYLTVMKNPGGSLGVPVPNTVGSSDNKRFVIHQEMIMLQKNQNIGSAELGGNPRTLFNGVIVIPKGYRRFGPNDILSMHVLAPGVNIDLCLQCHYKEFR